MTDLEITKEFTVRIHLIGGTGEITVIDEANVLKARKTTSRGAAQDEYQEVRDLVLGKLGWAVLRGEQG